MRNTRLFIHRLDAGFEAVFSPRLAVFALFPSYFLELALLRRVPVPFFAAELRVEDFVPRRVAPLFAAPVDLFVAVLTPELRVAVLVFVPEDLRLVVFFALVVFLVPEVFLMPALPLLRPVVEDLLAVPFVVPVVFDELRDAAALRPPFLAGSLFVGLPLPDPLFFPPPSILLTVAQALLSASSVETPCSL